MIKALIIINLLLLLPLWFINKSKAKRNQQWFMPVISTLLIALFFHYYSVIIDWFEHPTSISLFTGILDKIINFIKQIADTIGDKPELNIFTSLVFTSAYLVLKFILLFTHTIVNFVYKKTFLKNYFHDINKSKGEAKIKDEYLFLGMLFRVLGVGLFSSTVIVLYLLKKEVVITWYGMTPFLILPLLEIGFFLDGKQAKLKQLRVNVDHPTSSIITKFDELFKAYKATFKDKLIAFSKVRTTQQSKSSKYQIKNQFLAEISQSFIKNKKDFPIAYLWGLDLFIAQDNPQNIIFTNANDEKYGICLRILFDYSYLKNNKVIIIVLDQKEKNKTLEWLNELLSDEIIRASDTQHFDYKNKNNHIIVDTIQNLIQDPILFNNYHLFYYCIVLDVKNFIRKNSLSINTFFANYHAKTKKYPRLLGFSNLSNNLEVSYNNLFINDDHKLEEIDIKHPTPLAQYILVFKQDGIKKFESYIDLNRGSYIGREVPLAYFAHKRGIKPITIASELSAIDEELQGLEKNTQTDTFIKEDIKVITERYFNKLSKNNKVFILNDVSNLHQTLNKWLNYNVSDEKFLIIVASPYLFRQYLSSNISFVLKHSHWYKEILPTGKIGNNEKAFLLLSQLSTSKLEKNDILFNNRESVNKNSIVEYINKYSYRQIKKSLLKTKVEYIFEHDSYKKTISYSIPDKNYYPNYFYYQFVSQKGNVLGICLKDDIRNKYIKRMKIILNSSVYEITHIDDGKRKIELTFTNTQEVSNYTIPKNIKLTNYDKISNIKNEQNNNFTFSANFAQADIGVSIDRFLEQKHHGKTTTFEPRIENYKNKKILQFSYIFKNTINDEIRKTYEYLFKEIIVSIFPKTHHLLCIKAVTKQNREDLLGCINCNNDKELSIIIMETSVLNYHLLETIIDQETIQRIHELMHDYLTWGKKHKNLSTSKEQKFDTIGLTKRLAIILDNHNELTQNRIKHTKENKTDQIIHHCDFCANPLPLDQFEALADGRERCEDCKNRSVENTKNLDYAKLVDDAINYLQTRYDISIDTDITVNIVNPIKISELLQKDYKPTPGYDPRAIGLAYDDGTQKSIWVENAAPYFRAMAVIIHELTHIWQFQNLNYGKLKNNLVIIEGQAHWVELTYVEEHFPDEKEYVEQEKNRKDEYGKGYQYVEKQLKKHKSGFFSGLISKKGKGNPFEVYKKLFS